MPIAASTTVISIVSAVSLALGWGLLAGLWFFVFREKPGEKRARLEREARLLRMAAGEPEPEDVREEELVGVRARTSREHQLPRAIERRAGSRFRRR